MIGIYKITCKENNQFYIGSSKNIQERWLHHLYDLKNNKHHSIYLQRSFNKYGEKSLTFEVMLEMVEYNEELLRLIEYYYIEELKPSFNSMAPCIYEQTQHWRDKISASTKQLYKEGYINPRRDVGKRYNVYNIKGELLYNNITMREISCNLKSNYHTFNSMLRKYNGICCSTRHNCLIMEVDKTFRDLNTLYKTTLFNNTCPIIDMEGNTFNRVNYYKKSKPHKGQGIKYSDIYKMIIDTDLLFINIDDKILTLPYLCLFIQQCISINT